MNIKHLKHINDMASSRLSGIKARAARRDEEIRKQQEEAERAENERIAERQNRITELEKYLDGMKPTMLPLISDTWDVIQDLLDNGFKDELDEILTKLYKGYGIQTNPDTEGAEYMNYTAWLDGDVFCVGLWIFRSEAVDFGVNVGDDLYWYEFDGEDSRETFEEVIENYQLDEIKSLLNTYIDYFNDFLAWVDAEFPNE